MHLIFAFDSVICTFEKYSSEGINLAISGWGEIHRFQWRV